MATKTITIDLEAYRRLKEVQEPTESFSQTIKRVVRRRTDVQTWLKHMHDDPISRSAVRAIEHQVSRRRRPGRRER